MHVLSTFEVTERDLPDRCAYCGAELKVGDDVFDVYGDLYHIECWQTIREEAAQDADDLVAGTA